MLCVWIKETIACLDVTASSRCGVSHLCLFVVRQCSCCKGTWKELALLKVKVFWNDAEILPVSADIFYTVTVGSCVWLLKVALVTLVLDSFERETRCKGIVLGLPGYKDRTSNQSRFVSEKLRWV